MNLEKLLEYIHKEPTRNELIKFLGGIKEAHPTITELTNNGFIRIKTIGKAPFPEPENVKYELTLLGKEKLKELSREKGWRGWIDKKQAIPILFTIGMFLLAYFSLQIQIQSMVPNKPDLNVYTKPRVTELNAKMMASPNRSGEKVELYVKNNGRQDTGPMNFDLVSPDYLHPAHSYLSNVKAGRTENVELYIKQEDCFPDNPQGCNKSKLPNGTVTAKLSITCHNCDERPEFDETIELCIWHNTNDVCHKTQ